LGTSAKRIIEDKHWYSPSNKLLILTSTEGRFIIIEGKLLEEMDK
jgi:hypothetical protein